MKIVGEGVKDMEFKPINTQEEFDERIAARLQRERDSVTKNYADYEQLKKQEIQS